MMTKQGLSYPFFDHWFENWDPKVMVLFLGFNITLLVLLPVNDNLLASPRLWNTELVPSGASLTSWGEGASLALVGNTSSDGVTIKMPYGVDVSHPPASHPIFSYWVG